MSYFVEADFGAVRVFVWEINCFAERFDVVLVAGADDEGFSDCLVCDLRVSLVSAIKNDVVGGKILHLLIGNVVRFQRKAKSAATCYLPCSRAF